MPFEWDREPEEAFGQMADAYALAIHNAVLTLAERYEPDIEAWMKSNAKWVDRSGNARQLLSTEVHDIAQEAVVLFILHGVEYGTFLELANGGRYAILAPALDTFIPRIWNDVQALLR